MDEAERQRLMEAGRAAFNRGEFYEAHEHWEDVWNEVDDPERTWISDEPTERFGVIERWDREPGEFPQEIRDLIGKDPEIAEEFDVEG